MTESEPKKIDSPDASAVDTHKHDKTIAVHAQTLSNRNEAPAPPLPEKFGRYRIMHRLGQGAMGTVYRAHDTQLDRQVALKVPQFGRQDVEGLERFFREARVMASLRHPNLCPVYDAGEIEGTYYLTMAYIQGEPLSALMRPPWRQHQVASLFEKLGRAVHEAHKAGVVHRDLKPSNIMIERGEPIIMDFGLATRQVEDLTLTKTGTVVGTPSYMSPEQVTGEKNIGPATDIYSLGVILYQMLSGELPFQGSLITVLGKIVMTAPPSLMALRGDIDERLEWICMKALAKRPEDRFADGMKMSYALAAYVRGDPDPEMAATEILEAAVPPVPTSMVPESVATARPIVKPFRSHRRFVGAALVLGILSLAFVGWRAWVNTNADPTPGVPAAAGDQTLEKNGSAKSAPDPLADGALSPQPSSSGQPIPSVAIDPSPREKSIADQVQARYAAARDLAQRANRLAELRPADDPQLIDQDQLAIAEYRAAIDTAEQHQLKESAEWRAELTAFESSPRFQNRAVLQKAREQLQTHFSDGKAFIQQADELAKDRRANDPQLDELDQQAIDEFRAALKLAGQHRLEGTAVERVQAELLALENSPRSKDREKRKKARQEIEALTARGQLTLSQDPKQAAALFTEALQLSTPDVPQRWTILRDRSTAYALLARKTGDANALQLAFDDIVSAIKTFPQPPEPLESTTTPSPGKKDLASLFGAKASLAEEIDETKPTEARLQEATAAFEQAARLDPQKHDYPLGIARTTLKHVQRDASVPADDARFSIVDRALATAIALKATNPESHNLQGELSLLRGEVSAARAAFDRAVAANEPRLEQRARYYCNLSRSFLSPPADPKRALDAADQAIAIDGSTTGRFCRGQALRLLKRAPLDAIREFDQVLQAQPHHVEALLARSQLVVETPEVAATQITRAYQDIATALNLASTTPLKAEAYYVQSLARMRDLVKFVDNGSPQTLVEDALIKCQQSAWEAVQLEPQSTVYKKHAKEVFESAAKFKWQDADLQQESTRLRQQYDTLSSTGRSPANK